jgi:hypothetical protein
MNGYWTNFIETGIQMSILRSWWHMSYGWDAVQVAPVAKVESFEEWFATLEKY